MFSQSWTIFRVRGIPIRLHWSLLLLLPLLVYAGAYQFKAATRWTGIPQDEIGLPPLVWGFLLAVGLFASIVLHELAHAFVGMRSGAKIRSITLMMLGGVTRMEAETPPEREAWMAFAGPLTSVTIAAASYAVYRLAPLPHGAPAAVFVFAGMNLVLGGFNLLPAFPMDGGRILRGLLARRLGRVRATHVAARVGRFMAILFGLWGLLTFNLLLLLVAVFVYGGATGEERHLEIRDLLHGMAVEQLMTARLSEARPDETTADLARRLLEEHVIAARVVQGGEPLAPSGRHAAHGVVTIWDLARQAAAGGGVGTVSQVVHRDLPVVHTNEDAADLLDLLAGRDATMAVVIDARDEVVGLVTPDDIDRAVLLRSLERGSPP